MASGEDETMEIVLITAEQAELAAPLVAGFRVDLKALKGICTHPDIPAGREEILEYVQAGWPCYAAIANDEWIGYVVCRVEEPTVWVESLYVKPEARRKGIAGKLFAKAEEIAAGFGEETVFANVHPNNEGMIAFLRKRGYTVLNLIELRKPWADEPRSQKIRVGQNEFDY